MPGRDDDGFQQLTTPLTAQLPQNPVTTDENQHGTLVNVFNILEEATTGLYTDFNAFSTNKNKDPDERAKILLHDVEVKQEVYAILSPILQQVGDAIAKVDDTFKRRQTK